MDKPVLSDAFTVEDIHTLREYTYEQTKGFTAAQMHEYYRPSVEKFMAELEAKRNEQNKISNTGNE